MKLAEVNRLIDCESSHIDPALLERDVDNFVIDSREVRAGDVFFALSQPEYRDNGFNGDFDDATVFAAGAFAAGAVACVVRIDRFEEHKAELSKFRDRTIFVNDSIKALQQLAHGVYLEWDRPVVGITGSAGKTTAKELTAHVLASSGRKVLRNIKNYNNGLGHPLTVLNLAKDKSFDIAVLEMGMSTPMNEIARLCRITPPDVSVVLNVMPVHIEHLGSIEAIASAKAEIVEGMKPGGTAVLNADDPRVAAMADLADGEVITFGISSPANVTAIDIEIHGYGATTFDLVIDGRSAMVELPLTGRHNIMNSLAAAGAGSRFGMSVDEIALALSSVSAPPQRGEVLRFKDGFVLINDSYNSNPDALVSMVRTLVEGAPPDARKIVVAGEMLELGPDSAEIHRAAGRSIAEQNVDLLIGVRGNADELVKGAVESGQANAVFAADSGEAAEILCGRITAGDVVLVKGSRGVRTEKVIEKILEKFELEGGKTATVTRQG